MPTCYNGPNPIRDEDRYVIWRWAKANGIDHGLPYEKVHDAINQHFFNGAARPEWISDILSGRKTPLRPVSDAMWRAMANRRTITNQAKSLYRNYQAPPVVKALRSVYEVPRRLAVAGGHGVVFPVTHAGDLILRPQSWGTFFKGMFNTWGKGVSLAGLGRKRADALTERELHNMRSDDLYTTALRSGLEVGEGGHVEDLAKRPAKSSTSTRAWELLKTIRFQLWKGHMEKFIKPGMTEAEILDYGKNFAEWANHATGSIRSNIPGGGMLLFGPKLTGSKLARLAADPAKTINTFANWKNATAGERAVALTRFSGAAQYVGSALGLLVVNQGFQMATGSKDNINFDDPKKGDFWAFKAGGLTFGIPGLHSELKTLAQILAVNFVSDKEERKQLFGKTKNEVISQTVGNYFLGKANPMIGVGKEILTRQGFPARPVPWSSAPGTAKQPRYEWPEYLLSKGPIPLSGPVRYVFDHLRQNGASVTDAYSILKGLITYGLSPQDLALTALGITGLHAHESHGGGNGQASHRTRHGRSQVGH